jgi:F0F1-type ATP synthase assembly protein I
MPLEPKFHDPGRREKPTSGAGNTLRDVAPHLTLGIQLAAAVIVFFLIGWWLDTREGTKPLFMLIGVLVGFVGGMIKFLKSVTALSNKS